jgi:uncharacterized phiE125 gp8 family phage protein
MAVLVVTPAEEEPLTLQEAKQHLHVGGADGSVAHPDDALIGSNVAAARSHFENISNVVLVSRTLRLTLDRFPCGVEAIRLPRAPVRTIVAVRYIGPDGVKVTMPADDYDVDVVPEDLTPIAPPPVGRVAPAVGKCWPVTKRCMNAVEVDFVAGFGEAADVPEDAKSAMKLHLGLLYEYREAINVGNLVSALPFAYAALVEAVRVHDFP